MLIINDKNQNVINEVISKLSMGESMELSFEMTSLKLYFFQLIKKYIPDSYIINCESSERRLLKDLTIANEFNLIIYDNANNIRYLENFHILDKINVLIY